MIDKDTRDLLFSHCEKNRFRFAVTDCEPNAVQREQDRPAR